MLMLLVAIRDQLTSSARARVLQGRNRVRLCLVVATERGLSGSAPQPDSWQTASSESGEVSATSNDAEGAFFFTRSATPAEDVVATIKQLVPAAADWEALESATRAKSVLTPLNLGPSARTFKIASCKPC